MEAANIVVWVEREQRKILIDEVDPQIAWSRPETGHCCDPIGRLCAMARDGRPPARGTHAGDDDRFCHERFDLGDVLREFAKVRQLRALGDKSFPMCRALTKALIGRSYEFNTMSFEELLATYAPNETAAAE
jgi:hypothetical protein